MRGTPIRRNYTLLFVEDEEDLLWLLKASFEKLGYRVLTSRTAESGLSQARRHRPDLVVADIGLPRMDGLELVSVLRRETTVPIVLLTGRKSKTDRLLGFRLGADDYVTKPFSMEELAARVQAILRRRKPQAPCGWSGPIKLGRLEADLDAREVRLGGRFVALAPKEVGILKILIEAGGKVVSRDEFLRRVWGYDDDCELTTRTVDQHVARLRKKLRQEGKRIVMVRSCGYKLRFRPA